MANAAPLDRFTEKQVQNMKVAYTPKGLEHTFTPDSENELELENATSWLSFRADANMYISFVAGGTDSAGSQRFFWEANTRLDLGFGNFIDKLYVQNVTAGQGTIVHLIYRD